MLSRNSSINSGLIRASDSVQNAADTSFAVLAHIMVVKILRLSSLSILASAIGLAVIFLRFEIG